MESNYGAYGKSLEEAVFFKKDTELIAQQREKLRKEQTQKSISDASGISNPDIRARLVELKVTPEMATSLSIVPLIEVAWADGEVDDKERMAVLAGAEKCGLAKGRLDYEMLKLWLERKPTQELLDAWNQYMRGLCEVLSEQDRRNLRDDLLRRARLVAESSGSFLGITSGISGMEKAVLEKLSSVFSCKE